jgi:hypothetical protein
MRAETPPALGASAEKKGRMSSTVASEELLRRQFVAIGIASVCYKAVPCFSYMATASQDLPSENHTWVVGRVELR